jgi:hypothetical protein
MSAPQDEAGRQGAAWRSMRNQMVAACFSLIMAGAVLAVIGLAFLGPALAFGMALSIIIAALAVLAIRPWRYLLRLEAQMQVQKDALSTAKGRHRSYGQADTHWHHMSEDGNSPKLCASCGLLMDDGRRCRRCTNQQQLREEGPR